MNEIIHSLQQQLTRYQAIISVLEEKISLLERELQLYKYPEKAVDPQSFHITPVIGKEQEGYFQGANVKGKYKEQPFHFTNVKRKENEEYFHGTNMQGNHNFLSFPDTKVIGKDNTDTFPAGSVNWHNSPQYFHEERLNGGDDLGGGVAIGAQSSSEKESLRLKQKRLQRLLYNDLMRTSGFPAVEKAATTLWRLAESIHLPHGDLRKIHSMSAGGVAKHLMLLKRKGLIVKTGKQKYQLTPKAVHFLKEAITGIQ